MLNLLPLVKLLSHNVKSRYHLPIHWSIKKEAVFFPPLPLPLPLNPQSISQCRVIDNNSYQNLRTSFSTLIMQNKKKTTPPYLLHGYLHN